MNRVFFFLCFWVVGGWVSAQKKPPIADKNMGANVTIRLPTMVYNCWYCKRQVGHFIARTPGVLSYVVDAKAREIKIFYAPDLTKPINLRVAIANAGFQADTVQAEENAVKLLPVCCRQPIDAEWVKQMKEEERARAKEQNLRYKPLKRFLCCELCDYYYKYKILKDSSIYSVTLMRRKSKKPKSSK